MRNGKCLKICVSEIRVKKIRTKVEKNVKRQPGFDPITFSENSNYGWENLLEV